MLTRPHLLATYKEWGCVVVPLNKDTKKPQSKWTGEYDDKGKKIYSWKRSKGITFSDEEILAARSWGIDHEASGTVDADIDDSERHAHKFSSSLLDTHSVGKKLNGSNIPTTTHKLYFKPDDVEVKTESYGKNTDAGCIIELLPNTQSKYVADDLYITHDRPPKRLTQSELQQLRQTVKEIYFLAMASRHYPPKHKKRRDEYVMRIAGVMALHTDWSISKREDYLKRLLIANNDTDEVKNRIDKIKKQEKKFKEGKDVYGIPALVKFLKADAKEGLDWIDVIKKGNEEKRYPLVNARQFIANNYPMPKFIMFPIFSERSANQIFGGYESGKTIFGLAAAMHMCSGADFVGMESKTTVPTAYVEGELPAAKVRERFNSVLEGMKERGIKFNWDWFHVLTKDDLAMHGFKYGFNPIAVSRNLSDKDAEDYGRKGREFISNWVRDIEKRLGQPPFFILDNMTALADFDENSARDWTPFIQWITNEKNKGFANCFMHHSNKQSKGKGSSGSTAKERLLDTSIEFSKLDAKHRFEMPGNKNLQCKVHFDKARDFGGSIHDQDFILTMTEEGKWERYPYLDKYDFTIIKLDKRGLSVKDIVESLKDEKGISKQTIYKKHKRLRDLFIIKEEKPSFTK